MISFFYKMFTKICVVTTTTITITSTTTTTAAITFYNYNYNNDYYSQLLTNISYISKLLLIK